VSEVFVDETEGYGNEHLTPELVRDNLARILAGGTDTTRVGDPLARDARARERFRPRPYLPA
jgi:hypothetical protein